MNKLEPYKGIKSRHSCPSCGYKNEFTRYIDDNGNYIADHVGKCNRADKCGYHLKPREYLEANGIKPEFTQPLHKPEPIKEMFTHPLELMEASLTNYHNNSFALNLKNYFGESEAIRLLKVYASIGTSMKYPGGTIYWQIDINGNVRAGKIMQYNTNFKRINIAVNGKEKSTLWVHGYASKIPTHMELRQCFFGEHLLRDKTKTVCIVESEKTAIICSHFLPEHLWLAAGNLQGLSERKMQVLRGRTVILFPDLGAGFIEWTKKAKELQYIANVKVSDFLEKNAAAEQRANGLDLADFYLSEIEQL